MPELLGLGEHRCISWPVTGPQLPSPPQPGIRHLAYGGHRQLRTARQPTAGRAEAQRRQRLCRVVPARVQRGEGAERRSPREWVVQQLEERMLPVDAPLVAEADALQTTRRASTPSARSIVS